MKLKREYLHTKNAFIIAVNVFVINVLLLKVIFQHCPANLHKNFRFIHRRIKIIGNAVKVRQKKAACLAFYMQNELSPKDTSQ